MRTFTRNARRFLCIVLGVGAWAHGISRSEIKGAVPYPTGMAVPNAHVKVTQTATGAVRTVISGPDGRHPSLELPADANELGVTKPKLATCARTGIVWHLAGNPTLDVIMLVDAAAISPNPQLETSRNYSAATITVAAGLSPETGHFPDGAMCNDPSNGLSQPLPLADTMLAVQIGALPAPYGLDSPAAVNAVPESRRTVGGRASQDAIVAKLEDAANLERIGEYAAAEKLLLSTLRDSGNSVSTDPLIALIFNNLGSAFHLQERYMQAERCFRKALEIYQTSSGRDANLTARFTFNLAQVYLETSQYAKAERLEMRPLATRLEASEPGDPEVTRLVATIGALAAAQRRYGEAESAYKQALASTEKHRPDSDETVQLLNNLGILYQKTGRNADALSFCERALSLAERILGPNDPRRAKFLLNVGALQQAEHGPAAAEPFYQRALLTGESVLGPQHPLVGEILANYATALRQMKRRAEAKACERRVKTILHAASEANHARYTVDIDDFRRRR